MKKLMIGLGLAAGLSLTGCVQPTGAAITTGGFGGLVIDHVAPATFDIDNAVKADKCGKATCKGIVFFSTGDNSVKAAMENGGIKKIHHVDVEMFNIFNIYSTATTIVWGE